MLSLPRLTFPNVGKTIRRGRAPLRPHLPDSCETGSFWDLLVLCVLNACSFPSSPSLAPVLICKETTFRLMLTIDGFLFSRGTQIPMWDSSYIYGFAGRGIVAGSSTPPVPLCFKRDVKMVDLPRRSVCLPPFFPFLRHV